MALKRIGLFGGTFDPPHRAHLALAQLARDHLKLDEVRWLPAGQPWQKMTDARRALTAPEHRAAMVALTIQGEPRFVLDDRELRRQGPSYTIDSVRELMAEHADAQRNTLAEVQCQWVLIIGQDQLGRFDTWRDWRELLQRVTLAVAGRAGTHPQPPAAFAGLEYALVELPLPAMPVSSTLLRDAVVRGEDIAPLAGPAVARYIAHHDLYRRAGVAPQPG